MNNKGKIALEILIVLVIIVLTSGVTLALVNLGILEPKAGGGEVSLLNADFIPVGREGYLAVKEFKFCGEVDERYNCAEEKETFNLGEEVHFRFGVESSTSGGEVMLVENYRIKGPSGKVLLEVDEKNNFYFEVKSKERKEVIAFKDYFRVGFDMPKGEYVLELVMENPLLNKKATLVKRFEMR